MSASIPEFPDGPPLRRLLNEHGGDDSPAGELWSDAELADVWRHQLSADLVAEIGFLGPVEAIECARLAAAMSPAARTVEDLLWHPDPDVRVLRLLQQRAATSADRAPRLLPPSVSELLATLVKLTVARATGGGDDRGDLSARGAALADQWNWAGDATRRRLRELSGREQTG